MRRRVPRLRAALGVGVLVALAMTGCVNIPTGGSVSTQLIDTGNDPDDLVALPTGPATDASPEQIIAGFVRAGRGPQVGYQVAREFLTPDFAKDWDPSSRVLISSTVISPVSVDDTTYSLRVSVSAQVDGDGHYSESATAGSEDLSYELVQNGDGQWRISNAPPGTVLSPRSFDSVFDAYRVYFFDPTYKFLVPDLRWFLNSSSLATRIVKELIAGPSPWLAGGALVSVFPAGTEMKDAPQISSGRATVDLSSEVSAESNVAQRRMLQQLDASLRGALSTVRDVAITVGGFPIAVQDIGDAPDSTFPVGADPVGGLDGAFGLIGVDGVQQLAAIDGAVDPLVPDAATLGSDRKSVAVRGPSGVTLVRQGADPLLINSQAGLAAPSMDPEGFVWTVPINAPTALLATAPDGTVYPIGSLPGDAQVVSFDVARDGARVLVALNTPTGPQLLVAGVIRNADNAPVGLGTLVALPVGPEPLIDASWVDGVQVVALSGGEETAVDVYAIGGQHVALGSLAAGRSVIGGNGLDGIRVLDSDGIVHRSSGGASWPQTGLRASFLATQL